MAKSPNKVGTAFKKATSANAAKIQPVVKKIQTSNRVGTAFKTATKNLKEKAAKRG